MLRELSGLRYEGGGDVSPYVFDFPGFPTIISHMCKRLMLTGMGKNSYSKCISCYWENAGGRNKCIFFLIGKIVI